MSDREPRNDIIEAIANNAETDPETARRVLVAFKNVAWEIWGDDFIAEMSWINDGWHGHHEVLGHVLGKAP